ncbi:hypothetical protein CDO73_21860 [Saccharibacillus sp. O23]|uniref:sulfatase-like hydrolase/transferase n=1 Tax=Saccharibacillus sp. O23 TaxID=2009338 RepID=UPI000B4DFE6D|nr:sulfatase-like hydrolase/transferase [Saccharibacillus sp. O23]OWR27604.1 hypothetical protein CDO73_21860 [Saccharibacillus sp. O23]
MSPSSIEESVEALGRLNTEIREAFANNEMEKVKQLIDDYANLNQDAALVSFKSNYFFYRQDYVSAQQIIQEGLLDYPFHFDLNLNLGIVFEMQNKLDDALYAYVKALKYASDEERSLAEDYVNRMISLLEEVYQDHSNELAPIINEAKRLLNEIDQRFFPLDVNRNSLIRKLIEPGTSESYMTNMYKTVMISDVTPIDRYFHKTETLKGETVDTETVLSIDRPSLVPVSLLDGDSYIEFELNGKDYSFGNQELPFNRFHYIRFNETGELKIEGTKPIFVGRQIPLQDPPLPKRLVLTIFVDGLSMQFLNNHAETAMPNTYAYFEKGWKAENCYATSEWTYPSVATMFTGKYTTRHGMFHPSFNHPFAEKNKLLSEYFKEAGYFTAQIGGDWRVTPAHGYHKGNDRTVYQMAGGEFDSGNIIMETIEHLEAFKEKNNFLWISLSDIHSVPDETDLNLLLQSQIDISERVNQQKKGQTTVLTGFDLNKHHKYLLEIQRIDTLLQSLYGYVENNYKNEEVLVVLTSDHGQSFLEEHEIFLHESRRKVPLFIKGMPENDGASKTSDELIELTDLLPILLNKSGLSVPSDIDGQLPKGLGGTKEREYVLTEAIHPNQTYKAVISDHEYIFQFENGSPILNDGLINLDTYSVQLFNKATGKDETAALVEKVQIYEKRIWEHIKPWLKLGVR